jgi:4-diphosphocytidyl-2-C-methyl-D-erythritol kinase
MSKIPRFPERAEDLGALLRNDLEAVTAGRYPEIAAMKDRLLQTGALGALMSGSGPTVFGIYDGPAAAGRAAAALARSTGWWTAAVSPL